MTAQILELASEESVDRAWDALVRHRQRLIHDGAAALTDRQWVEEDARLDKRFRRLFMVQEGSG